MKSEWVPGKVTGKMSIRLISHEGVTKRGRIEYIDHEVDIEKTMAALKAAAAIVFEKERLRKELGN